MSSSPSPADEDDRGPAEGDVDDTPAAEVEVPADVTEPARKRSRGPALDSAKTALVAIEQKMDELHVLLATTCALPTSAARSKKLVGQKTKMDTLLRRHALAKSKVDALYTKSVQQQQDKEDKLAKMKDKEENNRKLSDQAVIELVMLRTGKYEYRFLNRSDTADAIWPHIAEEFNKMVDEGHLPDSDRRSVNALKSRFALELGEFRLWCSVANQAVHLSGVMADEVEDKVGAHRRPSTHTFRMNGYATKEMSVPSFHVSGSSADTGGIENNLGAGAAASSKSKSSKGNSGQGQSIAPPPFPS